MEQLERSVSLYDAAKHQPLTWLYGGEPGMVVRFYLSWTYWLLGWPERALHECRVAMRLMGEVQHEQSKAYALAGAALLHQYRREAQPVIEYADAVIALAKEQGLALWLAWGAILRGWALTELGRIPEGLESIRRSLAATQSAQSEIWHPYIFCLLAEGYGKLKHPGDGLAALASASELMEKNGERYWEPEVHRLRAELLAMEGADTGKVELCLERAIESARRMSARSLELRAVVSLGKLAGECNRAASRAMVVDVLGWFTEGFDTPDLMDAKALLQRLV
jgi:adenylate cyclase